MDKLCKYKQSAFFVRRYVSGSLAVLLLCLFLVAVILSFALIRKENARARIYEAQLASYFEFHHQKMAEEMWIKSYEAIEMRVARIGRDFGVAGHKVLLFDENGKCVFVSALGESCTWPREVKETYASLSNQIDPRLLFFSESIQRYVYVANLRIGAISKGFLIAEISDPFQFYRNGGINLALQTFAGPSLLILIVWIIWLFASRRFILRPYLESLVGAEKKQAIADLAAQVAHDIRSPLVALKTLSKRVDGIAPDQRELLKASVNRIDSIATDLLSRFKDSIGVGDSSDICFAAIVVESIVAEKRSAMRSGCDYEIRCEISTEASLAVVKLTRSDFSRVLSNLINNAFESLSFENSGLIEIRMVVSGSLLVTEIIDNGRGMDSEVLKKVIHFGGTYNKQEGTGLGLSHAREKVRLAGGNLTIQSKVNAGTSVKIEIPTAEPPLWFIGEINLEGKSAVIVLDDDESVKLLWSQKLRDLSVSFASDPEELDFSRIDLEKTFFILDQEIIGSPVTGMDLIKSHKLSRSSVLVTSHFEDPSLQQEVIQSGAKMIPKSMIDLIAVRKYRAVINSYSDPVGADHIDAILIDDDPLMHAVWRMGASQLGKTIRAVSKISELDLEVISTGTPFYIDKNLGNESGFSVSESLFARGFKNISITSGEQLDRNDVPSFIREIRGKEFPLA